MARVPKKISSDSRLFCLNCGAESIPIWRKQCLKKEKFHRKKLWCYKCKTETNFIECRDQDEVKEFFEGFERGDYIDEAETSILNCRERLL